MASSRTLAMRTDQSASTSREYHLKRQQGFLPVACDIRRGVNGMNFLKWSNPAWVALMQPRSLLTALALAAIFLVPAYAQDHPAMGVTSASYVGPEVCKTCHENISNQFDKSPHWKTTLDKRGGPAKQGCEACHGPASAHVESADPSKIFSFKTASPKQVNERCLGCHSSGTDHLNFARSAHSESDLSCLSCHSAHHGAENQALLINSQPALCYGCHQQIKPQFNMPFHHRVEEGLIQCSDCHNPHGGFIGKELRSAAARDSVCYTCHADKQGPFVFEHQPIKLDGCMDCHSPHGSPNPRLLKTSNMNILCLKCHTASTFSGASGTPDFHNQAAQYQACTLCHVAVHGSNFDRHFLK
jgi:DmsE family decaheme c-type cytochrome